MVTCANLKDIRISAQHSSQQKLLYRKEKTFDSTLQITLIFCLYCINYMYTAFCEVGLGLFIGLLFLLSNYFCHCFGPLQYSAVALSLMCLEWFPFFGNSIRDKNIVLKSTQIRLNVRWVACHSYLYCVPPLTPFKPVTPRYSKPSM